MNAQCCADDLIRKQVQSVFLAARIMHAKDDARTVSDPGEAHAMTAVRVLQLVQTYLCGLGDLCVLSGRALKARSGSIGERLPVRDQFLH